MRSFTIIFLTLISISLTAQVKSNLNIQEFKWDTDTVRLSEKNLVPGTVELRDNSGRKLDTTYYGIRYFRSMIFLKPSVSDSLIGKDFKAFYRIYPFDLSREYKHKDISLIERAQDEFKSPFEYTVGQETEDFFELGELNKSGSISRGVSLGNNQDLAVNSNLDLQLSGKLTDEVRILAAISDGNLPIQPEGNTQQLQEFDRVFIQLYNDRYKLIAGDYRMRNDDRNHFLKYNKSLQGGSAEAHFVSDPSNPKYKRDEEFYTEVNAAVTKGKFAINKFLGEEGNQGPYLLQGAQSESFIVVISGTEKVYIDGKLMERGQNFDYVIDYNSAELSFTPNQIITKDKRITVEFQYSDRYFARSLYHVQTGYKNEKVSVEVNYYNEGDNKNQPLDRELSENEKILLSEIGDSIDQALVPNVSYDTAADLRSEILYKLVYQNLPEGPDSVFVYSTNPDSALWRVGFALIGKGQGDYRLASTDANGKVYSFIPRDADGRMNGSYMPVTTIVTPKRRQLLTVGGHLKLSDASSVVYEGAYSHNDINTLSRNDDANNNGFGIMLKQDNSFPLSSDEEPLNLDVGLGYEVVTRQFQQIERFRDVEFYRDWNLPQPTGARIDGLENDQYLGDAYIGLSKDGLGRLRYTASVLQDVSTYNGLNNKVAGNFNFKGFSAIGRANYVNSTEPDARASFLRYHGHVSQKILKHKVGVEFDEENSQKFFTQGDSLGPASFRWNWWEVFVQNVDSTNTFYKVFYRNRYDWLLSQDKTDLSTASFAEDMGFDLQFRGDPRHQFLTKVTYRRLEILDSSIIENAPEDNILGKIDYQGLFIKRLITFQTYYEIGSGIEIKKEVVFQGPLDPGQGNYAWSDLNGDGVQQKNEFFVAPVASEGIYSRVLLPTAETQRAYTTIFNQVIFIKPEVLLGEKKGLPKFFSYFSNKLTYRMDKKSNEENVYNPLEYNFENDSLLRLSNTIFNTFYINRLGTNFGIELNYSENNNRNLFVSGKESRSTRSRGIRSRWNITRQFTLNTELESGITLSTSENFPNRNFRFEDMSVRPEFYYQPGIAFRLGVNYEYKEQKNAEEFGGQFALQNNFGAEMRYNVAQKGSFQLNVNYILINFFGTEDPSITNEMLQGLLPGRNATWNLLYQRNLGKNMQLSVNYSGRYSEDSRIVHLGGAQVRAFF